LLFFPTHGIFYSSQNIEAMKIFSSRCNDLIIRLGRGYDGKN
jgi:hypothetical protein